MAGNFNGTIYGDNVDFSGGTPITGKVTTDGQLLIGSTVAPNIRVNTLTAGTGISVSNGSGTITVSASASVPTTFTEDTGSATPALNNLNLLGSGSITTSGSGSTVTTELTGLTNHAVLVGAGTSTITKVGPVASTGCVLMSNGVGSDPGFSTATYPLTTTVSQILYSSATNTVTGLATANRGVLTTGATGVPAITALATDGQLIIGSTAGAPAAASLTAGSGISITPGSNSITIAATGGGDVVGPASSTDNALVRFDGLTGKLIKNGVITEDNTGNLLQSASVSGASFSIQTLNTSNTASSTAYHQVQVAGGTASDAYYIADIAGGQGYSWGVDNSDSDAWVLSASTTPGTSNIMKSTTAGAVSFTLGNVDITRSASGATVSETISNTSNTASSNALDQITVAGTSAGDPFTTYTVTGGSSWSVGADNSDSDAFVVAASTALGTTNVMRVATTGEINYPLQPAFLAYNTTGPTNVTGDGTVYAPFVFDSEVFDTNGDYASNVFTAPVTGRYQFNTAIRLTSITSSHTVMDLFLDTSNRDYYYQGGAPSKIFDNNTNLAYAWSCLVDMDAADTAQISLAIFNGTKVIDVTATSGAVNQNYFSAFLVG